MGYNNIQEIKEANKQIASFFDSTIKEAGVRKIEVKEGVIKRRFFLTSMISESSSDSFIMQPKHQIRMAKKTGEIRTLCKDFDSLEEAKRKIYEFPDLLPEAIESVEELYLGFWSRELGKEKILKNALKDPKEKFRKNEKNLEKYISKASFTSAVTYLISNAVFLGFDYLKEVEANFYREITKLKETRRIENDR